MRRSAVLCLAVAVLLLGTPGVRAEATATAADETITSFDGTPIALTVFRPAGASADQRVPVVLDSHGWAGSRRTDLDDETVAAFLAAGYGVVSFDQRGHGDSGGEANVQDPDVEVRDTLPGVAVTVPEGQTLFLVVTPVADAFGAHGSRTPGVAQLADVVVELPVVPPGGFPPV